MAQLFTNNASSKLIAGITNVSLSLQVALGDGAKFPALSGPDYFLATLSKVASGIETSVEIVKVTARATDVFTIVRAQEGTTALAYAENDVVSLRVTAGVITDTETHKANISNPHSVTKAQVGLGSVDNTTDAGKPVSTAQQTALNLKANLTSNTFTGAQILSDQQVSRAMMLDCGLTVVDKGNSGTSTQTYDYTAGSVQTSTATGNHTIAFSNPPPTGNLGQILIQLTNGGAFTITWPTVNWLKPDGTTTTSISTYLAANTGRVALQTSGLDQILVWTRDAGTTWYGKLI